MTLDVERLDNLYESYGYSRTKESSEVRVYKYEKGRYFGVDIVPLSNDAGVKEISDKLKSKYAELSYATQLRSYSGITDAETELYRSFFSYDSTRRRISLRYDRFREKQEKLNGGFRYQYINSPFTSSQDRLQSSNSIISGVNELIKKKNPQLIIIEAAAGYGKTCTAYEILKSLIECPDCENPLLTELSRNRGAKIFRYILLDEIDREYPALNSDLVKKEIQSGRIPLIIDGFDELLDKSEIVVSDKDKVFDEVESMLDTIGNLLISNSKVILTTRKTAIFAGEEFDQWLDKWNKTFDVTRFTIKEPRIKDWLGKDRTDILKEKNTPVEYVANPVLLTYLRNLNQDQFNQISDETDSFVEKYFNSMMEREMERQDLIISPRVQYTIFKNVVRLMIEFDTSVESRAFMKEIIYDQNKNFLEPVLSQYPTTNKPTMDNLLDKLANHAFLDRRASNEDTIGFINDFVFGTFIGEIMSESSIKTIENTFSPYMVEIGATAYRVQAHSNKRALWDKIESLKHKFENPSILTFDLTLRGEVVRDFNHDIIQSLNAFNIVFDGTKHFEKCVFINCQFRKCIFSEDAFINSSFINCRFEKCTMNGVTKIDEKGDNVFVDCQYQESDIQVNNVGYTNGTEVQSTFEDQLLKTIWEIEEGYKSQRYMRLMSRYDKSKHKQVVHALERLKSKGLIEVKGLNIYIPINQVDNIRKRIEK